MRKYNGEPLKGAMISEKYDGVQGIWNGRKMTTRTGTQIKAPLWWKKGLPRKKLIGELFEGRNQFDRTRGIVMSKIPDDRWRDIQFMIFDGEANTQYAQTVQWVGINSNIQLDEYYNAVIASGGEGVVIKTARGKLLKLKPKSDDDGRVVGYEAGKGKQKELLGALIVELRNGRLLKIGSGFSERERKKPPEVGQVIKFSYQGITSTGLPRFASYIGIRAENCLCF